MTEMYQRPRDGLLHQPKINRCDVTRESHPERPSLARRSSMRTRRGPPQDPSGVGDIPRQGRASGVKGDARKGQASSRWQDEAVSPLVQRRWERTRVPKASSKGFPPGAMKPPPPASRVNVILGPIPAVRASTLHAKTTFGQGRIFL
ncbi:hypothetical protein D1007_62345 [Hordeum vulgare]|nr:hypothetical protein D1007_62345 [Hordeum vulgare]